MMNASDEGSATQHRNGNKGPSIQQMSSFDMEQPLPSPESLRERRSDDDDFVARRSFNSRLVPSLIALVVVLFFLSLGLAIGLKEEEVAMQSMQHGQNGRDHETNSQRLQEIVAFLSESGVSNLTDLQSTGSPQETAVRYLATSDPLYLEIPVAHSGVVIREGYEFVTRYVMVVLYFSTLGQSWSKQHHFTSGLPTCEWFELNLESETTDLYKYTGVLCNENGVITDLLLPGSNLKGTIPTELATLFSLKTIVLNNNRILGDIPSSLESMINLRDIWINNNDLTGTLPAFLSRFAGLRSLDLSHNDITGTLPEEIGSFQFIEMLALDNNQFRGPLGSISNLNSNQYGGMRKLKYLYLEGNQFDGPIGDDFLYLEGASEGASSLVAFDLSRNLFTGTLPSHIFSAFPKLQVFDAASNMLSGKLPQNMIPNEALAYLALQDNLLTGEISGLLPELQRLTHLDVSHNKFTGWHIDLGAMKNLRYLFLAHNDFPEGPFPSFVTLLTNLQELSLKTTQRTGTIPASLSNLNQLVLLDLDNNNFSGTIPAALGTLTDLQFLLLNRNKLAGSVPAQFSNLLSLRLLFLDSNDITGDLEPVCKDRDPFVVADCASNSQGPAPVNCFCCDKCCSKDEECNDDNLVPSHDGAWKFGYQRQIYTFGDELEFQMTNGP